MAISASTAASIVEMFFESGGGHKKSKIPFTKYYKAALSSALASPIGYAALKFISFPLLVLTKSSKPVPVMFVGVLFYGRRYTWYKVVSVLLLCGGIAMFSSAKKGHDSSADSKSATPEAYSDSVKLMIGIFLVSMNLLLDAFTSNEQDQIFDEGANSYQVMKNVNLWQAFYLFAYLVVTWLIMGDTSELSRANHVFTQSAEVRQDILWFCICASMGQILIFAVMKEFGSLVWITISITRKLITILFSVFMFNHTVKLIQWLGIAAVFAGTMYSNHSSQNQLSVKSLNLF
jgi:UDP-galactose transporter B1